MGMVVILDIQVKYVLITSKHTICITTENTLMHTSRHNPLLKSLHQ